MKLKRLALVAAVGGLSLPTYWQAASASHTGHECADGADNDGNGAADLNDTGCIDPDDDDESGGLPRSSGNASNTSSGDANASNNNQNTGVNSNDNSSSSSSGSTSNAQATSSSTACVALCDASALTDLVSGLL